jgi:predicted PurR-regulated permease PerM
MPLVGWVERYTPTKMSFTLALALVYLVLIGLIVVLALTVGTRIAFEANSLATRLPDLLKNRDWIQSIPLPSVLEPVRAKIVEMLQDELSSGGKDIMPYLRNFGGQLLSGVRYIAYVVVAPILAFFFLKDGQRMRQDIVESLAEGPQRAMVDGILTDINKLLGEYIRALVLLSACSFAASSIFLGITGAPYAVLLAGVAALLEFLPVVGPITAAIVIMLVTGLSGYQHLPAYAIFWIVYRLIQDYGIAPFLMSAGVELNPALVLFGLLAGDQIAGVIGMFFSVPVIAMLRVIYVRLKRTRQRQEVPSVSVRA